MDLGLFVLMGLAILLIIAFTAYVYKRNEILHRQYAELNVGDKFFST